MKAPKEGRLTSVEQHLFFTHLCNPALSKCTSNLCCPLSCPQEKPPLGLFLHLFSIARSPEEKNQITDAISNLMLKAATKRIIGQLSFCSLWDRKTPYGCKGKAGHVWGHSKYSEETQHNRKIRGAGKKAVWNYESSQGNLLCYYTRNKTSFQSYHSFIVSSIHAFIQQTFTGYPLHGRHWARQAGRMRRILVSSRASAHNCSLRSCRTSLPAGLCTKVSAWVLFPPGGLACFGPSPYPGLD